MKIFSKKIIEVAESARELIEKILRWRRMELDRLMHVKYEPHKASSRSQFDAIMADVNEDHEKVTEMLKIQALAESISENNLVAGLDAIDLNYDEKARVEHKKELKRQKEMQNFMEINKGKR